MSKEVGRSRDDTVIGRLYELAAPQGGYFTARQASDAGVSRQTLSYHATSGSSLERVGPAVYRLRRFPEPSLGHVIAGWLPLAHANAVVSHESALELLDLADVIADRVHVTLPRDKRGLGVPAEVRAHYTVRPLGRAHRRRVAGVPVTSVERTITDLLRTGGWTEQIDLAVQQSVRRGLTTPRKLRAALPATWQSRLDSALVRAAT
jgi:predicted transcriptional regulator of viral defense system